MAQEKQNLHITISTISLIKIVSVAILLLLLYLIRDILLLVLVSMVLASAMDPLVEWLYRKAKFPRGLSVILVYLVFIGFFGTVIYFLIPPMIEQFKDLGARLADLRGELLGGTGTFSQVIEQFGIADSLSAIGQSVTQFSGDIFQTTVGVVGGLVQVIAVLAISFYLISSEHGMKNLVKSFVPMKHKAYAVSLTDKIQTKIGYWLLGQLILSTFIFVMTYIALSLLGVKYALALALLAGLLEVVPYLGPILAAIPAVFFAFVQDPSLAVFVLLVYVIIQQIENYVLVPKIMGRTVGANPLIILVALLVGFKLAGIVGMLLAVPIVAALQVFLTDLTDHKKEEKTSPLEETLTK